MEDDLDTEKFNRAIWLGLAPKGIPFPKHPITGADLRDNRERLLAKYNYLRESGGDSAAHP